MSNDVRPPVAGAFGMAAMGLGSLALLTAVLQFFAGPFGPTPEIGVTLGEIG